MRVLPWLMVVVAGCGSSGGTSSTQLQTLISSDWTLQPGTEMYQCARVTLTRDMYVTELVPIAPTGTHHTVLSMDTAPTMPDSAGYACSNPFEFAPTMIYGSGLGSDPFDFPQGVGLKLLAGTQIHINLHLFNTSDSVLTGTSGTQVNEVPAADIANVARLEIDGPTNFTLPTGVSMQTMTCRAKGDVNLVAFAPHMHKLGTHETLTLTPAGASAQTLYDADYSFDAQIHETMSPIVQIHTGDTVYMACTYNNTTGAVVTYGSSSNNEMCFGGYWFYPSTTAFCQ